METLNIRQRELAALARSVRAAVVVPSLFALALSVIRQPQVAGFAIFGTFAHLVMVNYDHAWRTKAAQAATLTCFGAILVALGTLASANVWFAVSGAIAVGVLSEFSTVAASRWAVIRTPLLLAFMLAVAIPSTVRSVRPNLEGWLLSGIVAQPALLLLWICLENNEPPHQNSTSPASPSNWIRNAAGTGMAMGLAILLTRFLKVEHSFWVVLGVLPVLNVMQRSATRIFWKEQAGTLIGFMIGVSLVAVIGEHQLGYWLLLPVITFAAAYAASAVGFISGQAGFTIFAIILFCILSPQQKDVGIWRLEDIALGGAISLVVSFVGRSRTRVAAINAHPRGNESIG
jgi:hypothetical protein